MTILLQQLAQEVGHALKEREWKLVTAESCTGGGLAYFITNTPGSSQWFERGFVTYSNLAKQDCLGVQATTLIQFGAVSAQTVREMAEGALRNSAAQISIAITGIAGPEGGTIGKPVGTVWIGWASSHAATHTSVYLFAGTREKIREQSIQAALQGILLR